MVNFRGTIPVARPISSLVTKSNQSIN